MPLTRNVNFLPFQLYCISSDVFGMRYIFLLQVMDLKVVSIALKKDSIGDCGFLASMALHSESASCDLHSPSGALGNLPVWMRPARGTGVARVEGSRTKLSSSKDTTTGDRPSLVATVSMDKLAQTEDGDF